MSFGREKNLNGLPYKWLDSLFFFENHSEAF